YGPRNGPPRKQESPALTTTPPTTVPVITPLHSVAASAPPLKTASAKPTIPTRNPASLFIVPTPFFDFAGPSTPEAERSVAECLLVSSEPLRRQAIRRGCAPSTIWRAQTSNTGLSLFARDYSTKFGRKWREMAVACDGYDHPSRSGRKLT